jgi:pimeloyl-ACP methyl ester carboxylesterase
MHKLERQLHRRDMASRTRHPFDWGIDHLTDLVEDPWSGGRGARDDSMEILRRVNAQAAAESNRFFLPLPVKAGDFLVKQGETGSGEAPFYWLRYPSGLTTPYPENNLVHARFFPAGRNDRAVIISPQWNADEQSHVALCRGLNRLGISALRLSLPYHDWRRPPELSRADYMVSANLGRTIQSVRQAVMDIRRAVDWLQAQGVERVGVMGSSIGSCVSWLAFIHDERLEAGVFNMVSSWFGDVVWRALTTSHLRGALERELTAEEVREAWWSISPSAHAERLAQVRRPVLLISARYDLTFLPDLSRIFLSDVERHGVPAEKKWLHCGHYTIGQTPFKYLDGWHILNFFRRRWS